MNINDLTTAQIETILRFRHEFPDVKVWPSGEFGVVLVQTQSAGEYRVGRVDLDGGAPLGRPSPGRPSMPEGDRDAAVPAAAFASYCPHCFTGGPGEDDYCGSCGEYIEKSITAASLACAWCSSGEVEIDVRGQDHLCRTCHGKFTTAEAVDE